jgi:GNAT superfamily N-acetyltransferase
MDLELTGYTPGVLGEIIQLHAAYYHEHWGFDISFETQVGSEISEFMSDFRNERDVFLVAYKNRMFAGSIAIDGRRIESEGARLRWFIVAPLFQRRGVGGVLIRKALAKCRAFNYETVFLWTFEGLDAARSLYLQEGFVLCEENCVTQWGQTIKEQMFRLELLPS